MEAVLQVTDLYKRYTKKGGYAIENINFSVGAGEIVGLVGHNGAGKSTTIKCLEGMLPFDRGKIEICGCDLRKEPIRAKRHFGFVTDDHALFTRLTGRQYLSFMADVYGVSARERRARYEQLESVFRLGDALDRVIASYSHGMKQKVSMMGSLLHRPRLWVLDEPMTGLDAPTTLSVETFMKQYAAAGNGILFSSHDLDAVSRLSHRVIHIRRGRLAELPALGENCRKEDIFGEN